MIQYRTLIAQIKAVDPSFVDYEILPPGGIAGLSWQGRNNLIDSLRMERALALYKILGDAGPLQVETLRFLQKAVDNAYAEGVKKYDAGMLQSYLSREEAIGNYVDPNVRQALREFFDTYNVIYGRRGNITINNRDYDTSSPQRTWTVPDARVGNISFDWTLTPKTISNEQIRGFFAADSRPIGVVIVRPAQLGANNTYLIPRPAVLRPRRRPMVRPYKSHIPKDVSEMRDLLGFMLLQSPTFIDKTGYFPDRNLETVFYALNEGLRLIRGKLGEERYLKLMEMSGRMRVHFEADPEDKTDDTRKGCGIIHEMEELLTQRVRKS